ncbi:hypothetical protein FGB62_140g023 [Gracilaria domingensis]|nr:hypothetical protein FGB62_140g023 [Gracilaria domingensis]
MNGRARERRIPVGGNLTTPDFVYVPGTDPARVVFKKLRVHLSNCYGKDPFRFTNLVYGGCKDDAECELSLLGPIGRLPALDEYPKMSALTWRKASNAFRQRWLIMDAQDLTERFDCPKFHEASAVRACNGMRKDQLAGRKHGLNGLHCN